MSTIATTIEQSKRLLDVGLDPKSADMYWGHVDFGGCFQITLLPANPHLDINSTISPAWSLPKLWDIMLRSGVVYDYSTSESSKDVLDSLVDAVARLAKQGRIK